jgi:hypothetical protein
MKNVAWLAQIIMLFALAAGTACQNKQDDTPQSNAPSIKKAPKATGRLEVGDLLPPIKLDSAETGKPISLTGEGGQLTFQDDKGEVTHPKAAIGFFCRY